MAEIGHADTVVVTSAVCCGMRLRIEELSRMLQASVQNDLEVGLKVSVTAHHCNTAQPGKNILTWDPSIQIIPKPKDHSQQPSMSRL